MNEQLGQALSNLSQTATAVPEALNNIISATASLKERMAATDSNLDARKR